MSYPSGSITFRRFAVTGKAPTAPDQALLEKLQAGLFKSSEFGVPEEEEWGFAGPRHLLDAEISFESCVFADAIHAGVRVDTNKIPADVKKAHLAVVEQALAAGNPSGFISKNQKKDAKAEVAKQMEQLSKDGKHRKQRAFYFLWHLPDALLYCGAKGKNFEKLAELMNRVLQADLVPLSAGELALRYCEKAGKRAAFEDLRPTRFAIGPAGDGQHPDYPWVAKSTEPKDFVGNEFLVWLWHEADARSGTIKTQSHGDIAVLIDRQLHLDCSYGQTGKDALSGDGPGRSPEALAAIRAGKVPRKVGLVLDINRRQYTLSLEAESMTIGGAKLPDIEEADSPRVVFEERIALMKDLAEGVEALFHAFMEDRINRWETVAGVIRKWIQRVGAKAA